MSDLVQPLTNKATARSPAHMSIKLCDPVELLIITKHSHTILVTHTKTKYDLRTCVHENTLIGKSV